MGYEELRLWARGRRNGWGQNGELQMYVKMGRDANNFYLYRTPVSAGSGQAAWNPEILVDFNRFFALRQKLQNAYLQNKGDTLSCTGADVGLVNASDLRVGTRSVEYGNNTCQQIEPGNPMRQRRQHAFCACRTQNTGPGIFCPSRCV